MSSTVNTIEMGCMYQIIHPFKICNSIFQNYTPLHHYCGICPSIPLKRNSVTLATKPLFSASSSYSSTFFGCSV